MPDRELTFEDRFDAPLLDRSVWLPHYLPAWSSRDATVATWRIEDSELILSIPPEQGWWLPGEHRPGLRVSAVQSGNWSGPAGGTRGQQPWREGAVVREEQPFFAGWTPGFGLLELRARAVLTSRSMVAWWLVGLEDRPERCAEICVFEIFGDEVGPGPSAAVGAGLHAFRDPGCPEDFAATRLPLDVAEFHTYAVERTPEQVTFLVDGEPLRSCPAPPGYPMQNMIAVFEFPDRPGGDDAVVPQLRVDHVRGFAPLAPARRTSV